MRKLGGLTLAALLAAGCAARPVADPTGSVGAAQSSGTVTPAAGAGPTSTPEEQGQKLPVADPTGSVGVVQSSGTVTPAAGTWPTSTPEEQGMNSDLLAEMLETIEEEGSGIDTVTVVRNGTIVVDATVYPFEPDSRHAIRSCTKSVVSALIGIAVEEGHLEGVEQPVLDIFDERDVARRDGDKEAMTLEDLLTMSSGLKCRDSYLYNWRGLEQMGESDDWVQHMLDLPMSEPPGTRFEYCNGGSFLLSAIIQETTGMTAAAFAQEHLFDPLGITDVEWPSSPQGISIGWSHLRMRPHDMAKIGLLYLNEGRWEGKQVVPAGWVKASTRKHMPGTLQDWYGYQWWVTQDGPYMALGYAGQYIIVVPEEALVVVFTSELADEDFYVPQDLLEGFILPAIVTTDAQPPRPEGVARLEQAVEALASP